MTTNTNRKKRRTIAVETQQYDLDSTARVSDACSTLEKRRPVDPVFILPDGSLEDQIVHAPIPGCFVGELNLLSADVERREIVALGRLDLERHRMRSDVRGNVVDSLLCGLAKLRCIGAQSVELRNHRNGNDDGPPQRLNDRSNDG